MRLSDLLTEQRVHTSLNVSDKGSALDAVAALLANGAEGQDATSIAKVLREREALLSTGVGDEVAIPHGRLPRLTRVIAALALVPAGVDFNSIDHRPVRIFVGVLAPERHPGDQLRALARVSKLLRDARVRGRILEASSPADLLRVVREEEAQLT